MQRYNFVTLFNANYLSRGMVLYHSLEKHCANFHLYVVAFDDATFDYFQKFPQKNLTAISLAQFEDEALLAVKPTRSAGEYCWTSTASTVLYCIREFKLDHCVYIDSDMCFYSDPKVLFDEWGDRSVLITEHRYTKAYDQSMVSGIYCVQFVGFKNDANGIEVLEYWRNACLDWCYARVEDGKFGDQKYLDDWTSRFKGVHVLQHPGGGLAPWNMQQYRFARSGNKITGTEIASGKTFEAVFFHFHGLKIYRNDVALLTGETYEMNPYALALFFKPYVAALLSASQTIHGRVANAFNSNGASENSPKEPLNLISLLRWYLYYLRQDPREISGSKIREKRKHHHYLKL